MFTPGGIGATLSPTSAIFLTTTPLKGARITVFWSCASAKDRSAAACASAASAILTRLAQELRVVVTSRSWRLNSLRSASERCTAARARATAAS